MAIQDPLHLVGTTIAHRYAIESLVRLDTGSVVYRATNLTTNRSIAVRVLGALGQLPPGRQRALYEQLARDHAKLDELAAILVAAWPIRDVGTVSTAPRGKVPWVALDWPHGVTLAQLLQPGNAGGLPESLDEVVTLLEPIAVALAIAHEHNVVHGGITPDRILLRDDGVDAKRRATLLDFGVARALFAAEEKREPLPADDARALAGIAARLLARSCGADASAQDKTPRARGVVVNDEVEDVFAHALSRDSYATVGQLWGALRRALGMSTLRSLEQTIPPEPPLYSASRSLRPIARSNPPPPPASRAIPGAQTWFYAAASVAVLGLGAITFVRASQPRVSAASTLTACPSGMMATGGGTVRLGDPGDADDPPHDVQLSPLCIDRESVTTASYAVCAARGGCAEASRTNDWDGITADDHAALDPLCTARDADARAGRPINCVSWEMASRYCAERGARLPSEAEWELASRTTSAGIAEWVADWRAPIESPSVAITDPHGPTSGEERVVRGAHSAGSAPNRFGAAPGTLSHAIGFRCAISR